MWPKIHSQTLEGSTKPARAEVEPNIIRENSQKDKARVTAASVSSSSQQQTLGIRLITWVRWKRSLD